MNQTLQGRVALVTGASRGIGAAIAGALAEAGAQVVLAARSGAALEKKAAAIRATGGRALAHAADLCDPQQVEKLFQAIDTACGPIDLLVNNAGAFDGGPLDELSFESWQRVLDTNLTAPFLCTQQALQRMRRRRRGRIVNIGSISAHRVRPGSGAYSASKFGLWGLTQVTALEGRSYGVTCGCIQPGNALVERRMESGLREDDEPMMAPEQVANLVVHLAQLPDDVNLLEATILPRDQMYVGRG